MRVLLIEDDSAAAAAIAQMLAAEGWRSDATDLGQDGADMAKVYDYDLCLLDLCLPDISGYEVLRTMRAAKIQTPVMIISSRTDTPGMLEAFGIGADDYLPKPFNGEELIARAKAIVRRARGQATSALTIGDLTVDIGSKSAFAHGKRIHLTAKEYQMLELLAMRQGSTLTKEAFLNHIYGGMDEPELKIVDVFICKLRKKLAAALDGEHMIETVWGRGYVLRPPAHTAQAAA
jgi:two-component system cell cycle response regulator CtrA